MIYPSLHRRLFLLWTDDPFVRERSRVVILAILLALVCGNLESAPAAGSTSNSNSAGGNLLLPQALRIAGDVSNLATPVLVASVGTEPEGIKLTWNLIPGATSYDLLRSDTPNVANAQLLVRNAGPSSYLDKTVPSGIPFYYWLVARNESGTSQSPEPATGLRSLPSPGEFIRRWRFDMNSTGIALSPEGTLRAAGATRVYGLDDSLNIAWIKLRNDPITPELVITPDGQLVLRGISIPNGRTNRVVILDAEGTFLGSWSSSSARITEPAVGADGSIYVGTLDGQLVCLSPIDATPLWSVDCQGPILFPPVISARDTIIVSAAGAGVQGYSNRGALLWRSSEVATRPMILDGQGNVILATSDASQGLVIALDSRSGVSPWSSKISIGGGQVIQFLTTQDNRIRFNLVGCCFYQNRMVVTQRIESGQVSVEMHDEWTNYRPVALLTDDGGGLEVSGRLSFIMDSSFKSQFWLSAVIGDGVRNPFRVLLDRYGRLIYPESDYPGDSYIAASFIGKKIADSSWPMPRGDQQNSGRASREVRVSIGSPRQDNTSRVWPITLSAASSLGSIDRVEVLIDGISAFQANTNAVTFLWSGDALREHLLKVLSTDSAGATHLDGPWIFSDSRPLLDIRPTSSGSTITAYPTPISGRLLLEASKDLKSWEPVSSSGTVIQTGTEWRLSNSANSGEPRFYRVLVEP